jgi:hypothetical protein
LREIIWKNKKSQCTDSYVIVHNFGNKFIILFLKLNPLSVSPKGEKKIHTFPCGGRMGRG